MGLSLDVVQTSVETVAAAVVVVVIHVRGDGGGDTGKHIPAFVV